MPEHRTQPGISVWPQTLGKLLLLIPAFLLCYVATNHDYRLVVGDRLFIGLPGLPAGPDIFVMRDRSSAGGSAFLSKVKACAIVDGLVVGQFERGWFILDGQWSPRLHAGGIGRKEDEQDGWYPPHALYPETEKDRWLSDLTKLGLKTPPTLSPPRQTEYKRSTLICWAVVATLGIIWIGKDCLKSPTSVTVSPPSAPEGPHPVAPLPAGCCPERGTRRDPMNADRHLNRPFPTWLPGVAKTAQTFLIAGLTGLAALMVLMSAVGSTPLHMLRIFFHASWLAALVGYVWVMSSSRVQQRLSRHLTGLMLASWLVGLSVLIIQWPLRITFSLCKGSLGALVDRVKDGTARLPTRVGPFVVQAAEINRTGATCLWLDTDPAGHCGFMRCSPERIEHLLALWSKTGLGEGWYLVEQD